MTTQHKKTQVSDTDDGPDAWLRRAFEQHRRELHVHCYRLAGNVTDADDLVQETFLRAWRARDRFEARSAPRTWLYRIATNAFLDSRKTAARRTVPAGDPFEWCTELGPYPDALLDQDPQTGLAARETIEPVPVLGCRGLFRWQRTEGLNYDSSSVTTLRPALDPAPLEDGSEGHLGLRHTSGMDVTGLGWSGTRTNSSEALAHFLRVRAGPHARAHRTGFLGL